MGPRRRLILLAAVRVIALLGDHAQLHDWINPGTPCKHIFNHGIDVSKIINNHRIQVTDNRRCQRAFVFVLNSFINKYPLVLHVGHRLHGLFQGDQQCTFFPQWRRLLADVQHLRSVRLPPQLRQRNEAAVIATILFTQSQVVF